MRIQNICSGFVLALVISSPSLADDYCKTLKAALASARTGFTNIPGPADDTIPGWRDAKLSLPGSEACNVETDKRDISYFCHWQKEQSAALVARYRYMVQETDQCLTGFQKTTGEDRLTTWRNPAIVSVIVDGRLVMKKATNALMVKVTR
jgi:hypothetical protein